MGAEFLLDSDVVRVRLRQGCYARVIADVLCDGRMATNKIVTIAIITVLVILIIAVVVSKFR